MKATLWIEMIIDSTTRIKRREFWFEQFDLGLPGRGTGFDAYEGHYPLSVSVK
jgi:hypothetical protein